jgi:hypothetical protein
VEVAPDGVQPLVLFKELGELSEPMAGRKEIDSLVLDDLNVLLPPSVHIGCWRGFNYELGHRDRPLLANRRSAIIGKHDAALRESKAA